MEANGIVLPEREAQKRPVEQPQLVYVIGSHHGGIVAWRAGDPRIGGHLPRLHHAGAEQNQVDELLLAVDVELLVDVAHVGAGGFAENSRLFGIGIRNEPYTLCITGGLNTDIQMHVCDSNNDPIPGLYGVGTVVGDMYGDVYDYHVPGINLGGPCTTFGYLLGKNLHNGTW